MDVFPGSVDNDVRPEEQAGLSAANALKDLTAGLIRLLQQSWQVKLDAVQLNLFWKRHTQKRAAKKTLMSI